MSFELELPRTPRLGVKVYRSWTSDGLVLTQELAPLGDGAELRLVVP